MNHYPWNVQVLVDWLKLELTYQPDLRTLATKLSIPSPVLGQWLTSATPVITLVQLRAVAHYRGLSLEETIQWLDLKPAHVADLIAQHQRCYEASGDNARCA